MREQVPDADLISVNPEASNGHQRVLICCVTVLCMNRARRSLVAVCAIASLLVAGAGVSTMSLATPLVTSKQLPADRRDLAPWFSQYREVFKVPIFASKNVLVADVDHARDVLLGYLDNNKDDRPDNRKVVRKLIRGNSGMVMFSDMEAAEASDFWDSRVARDYELFLLNGDETNPVGQFDASLEEILHMVTDGGYDPAYPSVFGAKRKSQLGRLTSAAMKRGDFTYGDPTCDFKSCMTQEYFYWSLTSLNGSQANRCKEIAEEWRNCTPELMRLNDPKMVTLLSKNRFEMPLRPLN